MLNQSLNLRALGVIGLAGLLTACYTPPPRRVVYAAPPPPPPVVVYPAHGQSPDQLERDRYECHTWAVQQSGYDPSRAQPAERVVVQPANPPGAGTAVGAIAGAILGAAITGPRAAPAGAIVGGVTGAAIGASSDANAQAQANAEQSQINAMYAENREAANNYRRAISACLVGRGYTVS